MKNNKIFIQNFNCMLATPSPIFQKTESSVDEPLVDLVKCKAQLLAQFNLLCSCGLVVPPE